MRQIKANWLANFDQLGPDLLQSQKHQTEVNGVNVLYLSFLIIQAKLDVHRMKHIFTYLLILSVAVNVFFLFKKLDHDKQNEDLQRLHFWKKISHKEGYNSYKIKMKASFPETYSGQKSSLICFWDSLNFGFRQKAIMMTLDSIATVLGPYTFDYVFATEMDEELAKAFIIRENIQFKNFKIIGNIDDYISGVYNNNPIKWKRIVLGPKNNFITQNPNCPDPRTRKMKPYYLLMDNKGRVVYNNVLQPQYDTAFIRHLNSYSTTKTLNNLDY